MPTTISGVLSQSPNTANVNNVKGVFVSVTDSVSFNSTNIDCSADCESAILDSVNIGESDAFGTTKRIIFNVYGNLDGWSGFAPGYPGRTLIRFKNSCTIKNASFIFRGGQGTNQHQSSDGLMAWGWDGGVFGDNADNFSLVLENVEIIAPPDFSQRTGYWDSGGTASIKADRIDGLSVRNLSTVFFDKNPVFAKNIKIVNASWGAGANSNVTLKGLDSFSFLVQEGAIASLIDSKVSQLRWFIWGSFSRNAGYKFLKSFQFKVGGVEKRSKVACFDNQNNTLFQGVADSNGNLPDQVIDYLYISQASSGTPNSQSLPGHAVSYPILPSKCVYYKIPLRWLFFGYSLTKQVFEIAEINHSSNDNLQSIKLEPVTVLDANVSGLESAARDLAVVSDLSQLYDIFKVYSIDHPLFPAIDKQLVIASGSQLDLGNLNLIIDAAAPQTIAVNQLTNTITVKSTLLAASSKFSDLKTIGTISLLNGAIASFPYRDVSGISFKIYALPPKARVRITKVSDNSTIFVSANNNGEAIATLQPTAYVAIADAFLYYRSEDIQFNGSDFSLRLPLTPYTDKNGVQIASINPITAQVNLIRVDYAASRVYVAYNAAHPKISRDSLLYALEKFQSGYNPDIPGSQDEGLAINKPAKYQNEQFVFDSSSAIKFMGEASNAASDRPYFDAEIVHLGNETPWNLFDTSNGRCIILPVGQVINSPQVSGGFLEGDRQKLNAIPSTPVLTSDTRLNNLDVAISSRATPANVQVTVNGGFSSDDRTALNAKPSRTEIADLVLSAIVEPGWSIKKVLRLLGAIIGGLATGGLSPRFRNLANTKNAVSASVTEQGDRASVTYDLED